MKKHSLLELLLAAALAIAVQGCLIATQETKISPQITNPFKGTYKVDPYLKDHMPKTVAVLPFVNSSQSKEGSDVVRRGFYNHFSSTTYKGIEWYRVDSMLKKAELTDPEVINKKSPQELGKLLEADAVVYGNITHFDRVFAGIYSQVSVGAEVKMYDSKTGHFLWSGRHVARYHEGGISTTPVGLIATVIATAMNVREIQLLRACDDLFRDMVKTIPQPTIAEATRPPSITFLYQNTDNLPKKAGDEIVVVIQGDPGMQATFDIGAYRKGIEMKEVEPGGYRGIYRIVPGDNVDRAIVTGHLTDRSGNRADWVDAIGTVTLDTTPPARPANATTVGRNAFVVLKWDRNMDADMAGYRIYRSNTPLTGYTELAKTEANEYRDQGLTNFQKYYYKISAVDLAGNESEKTDAIAGMPVAPGPTRISGIIETDTVWYAGSSPYIIEKTVVVKDKAVLKIEPGTEILSRGGGLIVEGRISAAGDKESVITFDAVEGAKWEGISFVNTREKDNALSYCRIKNARAAVSCQASSPRIADSELTMNSAGIMIAGSFSKPQIRKNFIHGNSESGITAVGGALPTVTENLIRDNGKGIVVRDSAPVLERNTIIQNRGPGITVENSQAVIRENSIYDNRLVDMAAQASGEAVNARNNWWGTSSGPAILARIKGRIDIGSVLSAAYPEGKPVALPIFSSPLGGTVKSDVLLTLSNSPYRVTRDFVLDQGAVLYIEPGVQINFDPNTSILLKDAGVIARGTRGNPIIFTASGSAPSPGAYTSAIQFMHKTRVSSFLEHCIIKYADTALDVHFGSPEITKCYIGDSAQSGIYCRNDSSPKIFYNTFAGNLGEGAIKCVGMSRPVINYNNFINNTVAIQAFSSIYIDARLNWWGKAPPDRNLIWGDKEHINFEPYLNKPEDNAYDEKAWRTVSGGK
ncbi:MAG: GNA1162 family protein [Syntrophales bacterium]